MFLREWELQEKLVSESSSGLSTSFGVSKETADGYEYNDRKPKQNN